MQRDTHAEVFSTNARQRHLKSEEKIMELRNIQAALLAVTLIGAVATGPVSAQENKPIKIGLLLPYKGGYSEIAVLGDRGFQVALAEFGGAIGGRKIEVIRADTELTPSVGIQRFNQLVQSDNVDIVAGVIHSGVGIALSGLAETAKKPLVLMMAFSDDISGKFCNPYVARTAFSAYSMQYATGKYWAQTGKKTAVTVGPDYVAGRQFIDGFKRGFEENGGKVVEQYWSAFQKTKDFGGILANLQGSNAELTYGWYAGAEAVQFVKQYAEMGLEKKLPLYGDHWTFEDSNWAVMGSSVIGKQFTTSYTSALTTEASKKFVEAYRKMFNAVPGMAEEIGYVNGKTVMLTLQKSKGQVGDGAEFIKTLNSVEFDAPRGKLKFSKNSAILEKVYLVEVQKGADGKLSPKLLQTMPAVADLPGCTRL